ncbi:MAG: hypothetical protein WCP21_00555 [Armatimonadota bacterium]
MPSAAVSTTTAQAPPPTGGGGAQIMDLSQTLSDRAQLCTMAFGGLAFLTGSLGADSFFPPGKVADWWGFQCLRDNDPTQMGHNTDFLTRAANNMLYVLTATQKAQLVTLAKSQVSSINKYGYKRFVLMKAFRRLLAGDLPTGAKGLSRTGVESYSANLYRLDGQISLQRAKVMGGILKALTTDQRAYLDKLKGTGMKTWLNLPDQISKAGLTNDEFVAVMTYSGDLFSWHLGNLTSDVYFCPERQGTYFGGFYMKDAQAMGNPDYTIPSDLTGKLGDSFIAALTTKQAALLNARLAADKPLLAQIVTTRSAVATQLRKYITGQTPNTADVLHLCGTYGWLDGNIVSGYAIAFAQIGKTLTAAQKTKLTALRLEACTLTPQGAFLYSTPIAMPTIPNTDFLFASN